MSLSLDPRTQALTRWYEDLSPDTLPCLSLYYASQARFKDPFNDVHGLPAIQQVFEHMFATLHEPRFKVIHSMSEGDEAFLVWQFQFARMTQTGRTLLIQGGSHLQYDNQGLVSSHVDYWDTGEALYAKLPLIGAAVRYVQRQLATPQRNQPLRRK